MEAAVAYLSDYETERGKPMPSKNHGGVQVKLIGRLTQFEDRYRLFSETSLDLFEWRSTPDISIYPPMRLDFRQDEVRMKEPPLGVIEIVSASQSLDELFDKAAEYFEHGVKSCWLVVPVARNVYVFNNVDDYRIFRHTDMLIDEVLDISIPLDKVFA